jgi:membrane-bound inhibitor of C-type lysozyme
MSIVLITLIAAAAAAGCAGRSRETVPAELPVHFTCTNGDALDVTFVPARRVAVLIRNDKPVDLAQQPAASGFVYSNGPNTIRGKGDELIVEIGRMVPLQCTVSAR